MPRDVNGVYTLPPGNPVIPNTIIATNWANTTMDDIAAALTASLSVDGSVTTAKLANSSVTTIKIANGAVTLAKIDPNVALGISGVNVAVNGGMQIWQAATSLGAGTGIRRAADMYRHDSTGTTYSVARFQWNIGQTDVDPSARFYMRITNTSVAGAGNYSYVNNAIEGVRTLANATITVSFWAKADASKNIALELQQNYGTGGAPSTAVSIPIGLVGLTTAWQRISRTVSVPSILGKTVGTNGDDCLRVFFWMDAGSNFNARASNLGQQSGTFDFWGVKVELGSAPSQYQYPDVGTELAKCQRYYQTFVGGTAEGPILFSGDVTSGNSYGARLNFLVPMLFIPSVTYIDTGANFSFPAGLATVSGITTFGFRANKVANASAGGTFIGSYEADARI